ncbi:hypothetical protein BFP97_07350 [Roseivirga sp. 4D4]|uniref:hypothetical protein n=1 Tax=Roseivirga sp. 4D4 TaxID=1889784 RepID=UPI0008528EB0|nr:hypothetical protein [Roseivirga sp. 4D4]OEK01340.1 hypothetical protein BFP97_07350 [Roseivirga sp. 4D4]
MSKLKSLFKSIRDKLLKTVPKAVVKHSPSGARKPSFRKTKASSHSKPKVGITLSSLEYTLMTQAPLIKDPMNSVKISTGGFAHSPSQHQVTSLNISPGIIKVLDTYTSTPNSLAQKP